MDKPVGAIGRRIDLVGYPPFRVGDASVDPVSREARYGDKVERLQPQTLKVLIALHESSGQVVTREGLVEQCWDGRFVGEDVINRAILLLRKLADHAGGFRIETIPKAGYRLVEESEVPVERRRRRWLLPLILVALLATGVALYLHSRPGEPEPPTLALIPFTSTADTPSRDLAAASADTLSHMLLSARFPAELKWPATAADRASADLLLSGDVRKAPNGYAVLVQVRDRPTGTVILTRTYQADDKGAATLPDQIGAEITSNLTGALAVMVLDRRWPVSPQFTADKLKAIATTVNSQDPLAAYAISRKQVADHPNVPLAQLGLAFDTAFALGALPEAERPAAVQKARVAADRAQQMAPDFGDTYVPWCLLRPATFARECEDRMRAGMKADPDAPFVPSFLSGFLLNVGRYQESLQFARMALIGDPYHPQKLRRVIMLTTLGGDAEASEQMFRQARLWWPTHPGLYWDRLGGYALAGNLAGAERAIADSPTTALQIDRTATTALFRAVSARDSATTKTVCTSPTARYTTRLLCISALQRFGDRDTAFRVAADLAPPLSTGNPEADEKMWLANPYEGIDPILTSPAMKWLRSDPRYLELAKRTGLLAYWRKDRVPDFCRGPGEPVCASL